MKEALYYFVSDYCDVTVVRRIREQIDPSLDFAVRIIMDRELSDLRYLYQFGEYISDSELRTAAFLNSISVMSDAFNNLSDAASSIISFIGVKTVSYTHLDVYKRQGI